MSDSGHALLQARDNLRCAGEWIERASVGDLDACRPLMERAAAWLQNWRPAAGDPDPRRTLEEFRRELRRFALLLDAAAQFHLGRLQALVDASGGYSADGGPASMEPERHSRYEG